MSCIPEKAEFMRRAARGNLIPVWRELLADQDTPVSAYERVRAARRAADPQAHTCLLESVEGGEHIARYTFLGGHPRVTFRARGRSVEF